MYYILSFSTVISNVVLSIIWGFLDKYDFKYTFKFYDFQDLLNIVITPVLLALLNMWYIRKNDIRWYAYIPLILIVITLNSVISYIGWGVRTGKLLTPDAETVMVTIYIDTILPLITTILGIVIYKIVKH